MGALHLSSLRRRAAEHFESRSPACLGCTQMGVFGMSISEDAQDREARAATNHVLFREVNERVKEVNEGCSLVFPVGEWICECANDACVERIELSANEYELVRRDQARFFVAPSNEHVWPEVEQVIERNDHYWIVEKIGHSATAAARLDPLRASRGEAR